MTWYYSPSTSGFYLDTLHGDARPADCVVITEDQRNQLLAGQSACQIITIDENGNPALSDPPNLSDQLALAIRSQRNALLASSDFIVVKAVEIAQLPTSDWITYRQALRDLTAQKGFPQKIKWPVSPSN